MTAEDKSKLEEAVAEVLVGIDALIRNNIIDNDEVLKYMHKKQTKWEEK